jgi:hypothetical protein
MAVESAPASGPDALCPPSGVAVLPPQPAPGSSSAAAPTANPRSNPYRIGTSRTDPDERDLASEPTDPADEALELSPS